jgi:hypothetical protein
MRWLKLILVASLAAVLLTWAWYRFGVPLSKTVQSHMTKSPPGNLFVPAAPGTGTGPHQDIFQILANAAPQNPSHYTLDQLSQLFPAFQHQPFNISGFAVIMLPFSYSDPQQLGDSNEALALPALINDDLDWSPGSYNSRHAYFVFKRDPAVQGFLQAYDRQQIATFVQDWQATYAIGGQLIKTADGYKGKLQIFNTRGAEVFEQTYDTPRSYWDLLGDMDVDAMTAIDVKPSQALSDFLHKPRCAHFESVAELGSAAFMEESSPEELGAYQKILANDPGFAFVRHWSAHVKHWTDGDDQSLSVQNGQAINSLLEATALEEFNSVICPDAGLVAQVPHWLDEAEALTGADSPWLLEWRLRHKCYGSQTFQQTFDRALKAASNYPNWDDLLTYLAYNTSDRLLQASLAAASVQDLYYPGNGKKTEEAFDLAAYSDDFNREDVAMQFLSPDDPDAPAQSRCLLLQALTRAGRYAEAAALYPQLDLASQSEGWREPTADCAAFSAFESQQHNLLAQIIREQSDAFSSQHLLGIFNQYFNILTHRNVTLSYDVSLGPVAEYWDLPLVADGDALNGISRNHSLASEIMTKTPVSRILWIIQDNYQRRDPSDDASSFYEYLDTLFRYDPWVTGAVADYHKRSGSFKQIDADMLLADLQEDDANPKYSFSFGDIDWRHYPSPWRVSACVDQLLKEGNADYATKIAQLYDQYATGMQNEQVITIGRELLRRAQAAQATETP